MALKILIVGLGGVGQRHARNLRALLGAEVELLAYRQKRSAPALSDRMEPQPGVDVEEALGIRSFDDLPQALAEKPSAVIIANPTAHHLAIARAAAGQGCHLFIEKPLSHDMEGVDDLLRIVEEKGLVTLVAYQWRFHPALRLAKKLIDERFVGRIAAVRAEYGEHLPDWHPYEDYRQSYAARPELGGGVLLTQIHDFDYLGWWFGWPRSVYAAGGRLGGFDIEVEDTASTLLRCEVMGRLIPVHVHQDMLRRPPSRTCQIIGERGTLTVDLLAASVQASNASGASVFRQEFGNFQRNQLFLDEMSHFLACLEGSEKPVTPIREGIRSLRVALAALESIRTNAVVPLSYHE